MYGSTASNSPTGRARERLTLTACLLAPLVAGGAAAQPEPPDGPWQTYGTEDGEWRSYAGDIAGTKYSPLDQVDAGNFERLEVAWEWTSADAVLGTSRPCTTACGTGTSRPILVARDKATGAVVGSVDLPSGAIGTPMTYLASGRQYIALTVGGGPRLIALALPE